MITAEILSLKTLFFIVGVYFFFMLDDIKDELRAIARELKRRNDHDLQ